MEHIHHTHSHSTKQERSNKLKIVRYIMAIILFIMSFFPNLKEHQMWLNLVTILLAGYKLIFEGMVNIFHGNFEEDTLMTIAVISAFLLKEYPESCMVVLLFQLGEFIEDKAINKSNKSIEKIVQMKAKTANVLRNGQQQVIEAEKVEVGERILIKPGEMVPFDCFVEEGKTSINMASVTGESKPIEIKEGDSLLSGSINLTGSITCKVEKDLEHSTISEIIDLVKEASTHKGKTEQFITKFSKIYTPIVIIIAMLLAIVPLLVVGFQLETLKTWGMRALVFLVASCPCSIVISVPLAFFSCIGASSKKGMLIKGTKHIEQLARANCLAVDKTGTITTGKMEIKELVIQGKITEKEMLVYLYNLEKNSNHPISTAIVKKVEKEGIREEKKVYNYEEIPGKGIKAQIEGKEVLFGNIKLLESIGIHPQKEANYLVVDKEIQGYLTMQEEIREDSQVIKELEEVGIQKIVMLTGDNQENAKEIANKVGITEVYAGLMPQEKQKQVQELKREKKVIFIGDGINDSPVLATADFGIAMGEGTEIASNTADAILLSNKIGILPEVIKKAKKTLSITKFNIAFSLLVKAIVLVLGAFGYAPIWLAIASDTGVTLLTILNAIRIR